MGPYTSPALLPNSPSVVLISAVFREGGGGVREGVSRTGLSDNLCNPSRTAYVILYDP